MVSEVRTILGIAIACQTPACSTQPLTGSAPKEQLFLGVSSECPSQG